MVMLVTTCLRNNITSGHALSIGRFPSFFCGMFVYLIGAHCEPVSLRALIFAPVAVRRGPCFIGSTAASRRPVGRPPQLGMVRGPRFGGSWENDVHFYWLSRFLNSRGFQQLVKVTTECAAISFGSIV